jgi:hypothetical protein
VITQRARMQHAATAVPATASVSACAASCFVARVRADREEKTASPIPAESHVAGCMPAARKEAIEQHQAGKRSGGDVAKGLSHLILVCSAQDFIA